MSTEQKTKKPYYRPKKSKSKSVIEDLNILPATQEEIKEEPQIDSISELKNYVKEAQLVLDNLKESFAKDLSELGSKLETVNIENTELVNRNTDLNKALAYKDKIINNLKQEANSLSEKVTSLEKTVKELKNRNWFQRLFN